MMSAMLLPAYIGPGAGFALAGSVLVLVGTLALAVGTLLTWPIAFAWRWIRVGNPYANAKARRVVVVGMDGMDPGITTRLMQEGRLPNLQKLGESGVFRALDTSLPSMSPAAWSTFSTGVDASGHRIYDFLTRDPCSYQPMLSSTEIGKASRVLNIGPYVVPLDSPPVKLTQKSQAFWKLLGEKHVFSVIQRVPITFPPVPFNGLLLSGMCVPDLRGSQGTFSYFSTEHCEGHAKFTGGEQTVLRRNPKEPLVFRSRIVGPDNSMLRSGGRMTLPFTLTASADGKGARLEIEGSPPVDLRMREYSEWIHLTFRAMPGVTVSGIVRFYLNSVEPELNLYMTPVHIDPENPAMPISHPSVYSIYLAKKQGPFATLGLAEDTWALNERVIDERAFLEQALLYCDEREKMLMDALDKTREGFVTTVFDTTDRVSHMFYRYLDPSHPANAGKDTTEHADVIAKVYERADAIVGRVLERIQGTDTVLMVISDHGFTNFRRGVNLNSWLRDHGYLVLKDGARTGGDWFENVDWTKTKAFALGLTGLFVNRRGREASGIVAEGEEYRALVREICAGLEGLVDPATNQRVVREAVAAFDVFEGPYRLDAPDVLVGYEGGYRHSWECATGATTEHVVVDNAKSWSGDHCVDPDIVPGIFFCNRKIAAEKPRLIDIPFSVMKLFGHAPPKYMQGATIFPEAGQQATVGGLLDPASLNQSGAAPGALVHLGQREARGA
jgi:predicted AlkP superfamily phosphohydrolase/phosphomutase